MWPPPKPATPATQPVAKKPDAPVVQVTVVDPRTAKLKQALGTSVGLTGLVGLGLVSPTPIFTHMLSTFGLSTIVGKAFFLTQPMWASTHTVIHSINTKSSWYLSWFQNATRKNHMFVGRWCLLHRSESTALNEVSVKGRCSDMIKKCGKRSLWLSVTSSPSTRDLHVLLKDWLNKL